MAELTLFRKVGEYRTVPSSGGMSDSLDSKCIPILKI
jgi:hypothetical protein